MTTQINVKRHVIQELISNLISFNKKEKWSEDRPLVLKYIASMDEDFRHYHTWSHVSKMLMTMRELPFGMIQEHLRLTAAILFHDIVCTPGVFRNKTNSAEFTGMFYHGNNLAEIRLLIKSTEHEFPFLQYYGDTDVLCDLDLMILGSSVPEFIEYQNQITQESLDKRFSLESIEFGDKIFFKDLHKQIERGSIFRTKYFRDLYENQARENIKRMVGV